jgi:hypothetical protein
VIYAFTRVFLFLFLLFNYITSFFFWFKYVSGHLDKSNGSDLSKSVLPSQLRKLLLARKDSSAGLPVPSPSNRNSCRSSRKSTCGRQLAGERTKPAAMARQRGKAVPSSSKRRKRRRKKKLNKPFHLAGKNWLTRKPVESTMLTRKCSPKLKLR